MHAAARCCSPEVGHAGNKIPPCRLSRSKHGAVRGLRLRRPRSALPSPLSALSSAAKTPRPGVSRAVLPKLTKKEQRREGHMRENSWKGRYVASGVAQKGRARRRWAALSPRGAKKEARGTWAGNWLLWIQCAREACCQAMAWNARQVDQSQGATGATPAWSCQLPGSGGGKDILPAAGKPSMLAASTLCSGA